MAFPTTHWTVIDAARSGDSKAVSEFVERYRRPIIRYLTRRGLNSEAEDLSQEVFLRLFSGEVLKTVDPARGKFRSLVLAITRNVLGHHRERLGALKRGEGKTISMGEAIQELATTPNDSEFDQEWLRRLLQLALARLKQQHPKYHRAIDLYLLDGGSQATVAQAMECSKQDVGNYVLRGRRKLVEYIRQEIRGYTATPTEFNEELRGLARCFPALGSVDKPHP